MKPKTSSQEQIPSFQDHVEGVLKKFTDASWLGANSPLATPYFLGEQMPTTAVTPVARGKVLQSLIRRAFSRIPNESNDRSRRLIEVYYFENMSVQGARDRLVISKAQFHNDRQKAVAKLTRELIAETQPALRLEAPPVPPLQLIEREVTMRRLADLLDKNLAVFVTGTGGIGKTALGSTLAKRLRPEHTFWYTFRPGLNDHLNSFIFALGYFCYLRGASTLWQEVIAAEGQLPKNHLLEVVRHTLTQLPAPPLICLDEVDLLIASEDGEHAQLLQLLADLRGLFPMLLLGQRITFEAEHFEELKPLSAEGVSALLATNSIALSPLEMEKLETHLDGNPRLVELIAALLHDGESLQTILEEMSDLPSVHFLLGRILLRLHEIEVGVLMDLAVYESAAPTDIWLSSKDAHSALIALSDRRLVHFDESGGAFLLPAYREILLKSMPEDKIMILHYKAAKEFLQRGQRTQSARHYARTADPETAIWLWRDGKQQEISQGQAHAALSLFEEMQQGDLSQTAREQAVLHSSFLKQLFGQTTAAQNDLDSVLWRTPVLNVEAQALKGVIYNDENDFPNAELAFSEAILVAENLLEAQLAHSHKGLGWGLMQERHLDNAWREALMARYEAVQLQGNIELMRTHYYEAEKFYSAALEISYEADYVHGNARTCNQLALLSTYKGEFDEAIAYSEQAAECYKQLGKRISIASSNINIALRQTVAGRYQDAIDVLSKCIKQFDDFGLDIPPIQRALIHQGYAEAYLGLNDLDKAMKYVQEAITQEEISVLPDSYRTYGEIVFQMGDLAEAQKWIQSSIDLIIDKNQSDNYLLGYAWRAMARVNLEQGDRELAIKARDTAIELFGRINLVHEIERTKALLSDL